MLRSWNNVILLHAALVTVWSTVALAGKYNEVVDIGQAAPAWSDITSTAGQPTDLSDFSHSKVLVVVFTCKGCPVAQAYEERMMDFAKAYKEKGVTLVAIHVHGAESAADAAAYAQEKGFNFPYLHDESQQTAKAYGATTTPHVFVLDQERRIAYMGAFDDNMDASLVKRTYVREAVDALLRGETPTEAETRQFGCGVKWK